MSGYKSLGFLNSLILRVITYKPAALHDIIPLDRSDSYSTFSLTSTARGFDCPMFIHTPPPGSRPPPLLLNQSRLQGTGGQKNRYNTSIKRPTPLFHKVLNRFHSCSGGKLKVNRPPFNPLSSQIFKFIGPSMQELLPGCSQDVGYLERADLIMRVYFTSPIRAFER